MAPGEVIWTEEAANFYKTVGHPCVGIEFFPRIIHDLLFILLRSWVTAVKYIFGGTLLVLVLLSALACWLKPRAVQDGKMILTWQVDDNDLRQEQVGLFNRTNPKYKLLIDPSSGDMSKVIVQCLAGVGPELFISYDGFNLSSYVKAGIAWDITDELKKMGIDADKDLWGAASSCYTYEGRIYGFPKNVVTDALWYNKDCFDKKGIPYPKGTMTWAEFIALAQKLTVRDKNGKITQYGLICYWPEGESGPWFDFLRQWGGHIYSADGTRCTLDTPPCIAATQFLQDLVYKYEVMPSPSQEASMSTQGGWGSGGVTWFAAERAAMALGGRYWLIAMKDYKHLRLGVVESPHGPLRQYRGYGAAVIINKNSPHRQDALAFVKYMASQEYNELINHEADALAPVRKYCYTDKFLHDPERPLESENTIWRDVMQYGLTDEVSPFINGTAASQIMYKQLDLLKARNKSGEQAMKDAARLINQEIQKTIRRDPELLRRYLELTRKRAGKEAK